MSADSSAEREVSEFYDEEAGDYDERFRSRAGRYIDARQQEVVREELGDLDGRRVLEIAAGTGRFTELLVDAGADVVVVDISRGMLERNRDRNPAASYVHGSGTDLPLPAASVDACLTVNALNHVPGHWRVVEEVFRVLSTGGRFVANYPNLLSNRLPVGLYVNYRNRNVGGGVYTRWFNVLRVRKRLESIGFTVERCVGDRLVPVKAASRLTVPLAALTEPLATRTPLSYLCVSPFLTAVK